MYIQDIHLKKLKILLISFIKFKIYLFCSGRIVLLIFIFTELLGSLELFNIWDVFSFNISEYLMVLILWFADVLGPTYAIVIILDLSDLDTNESLNININFVALKGTCVS